MCVPMYNAYVHACGICMGMDMIVYMCLSISMHMFTFIIKLIDVIILYLIRKCVHGFVFKAYTTLSTV